MLPSLSASSQPPLASGSDPDDFVLIDEEPSADGFVLVSGGPYPMEDCAPERLTPDQRRELGERFRDAAFRQLRDDCERTREMDHRAAARRLRSHAGGAAQAEALLDRVVATLQNARMTINFKAQTLVSRSDQWFQRGEYLNCFELGDSADRPAGYSVGRAQIEDSTLGLRRLINGSPLGRYGRFESGTDATRKQRWFQSASRPVYGALDFLNAPRGAASHYGQSYLVLADHVKQSATFTPVDTFATRILRNAVKPDQVCTAEHFPRLVAHAQDHPFGYSCLKQLCRAAKGDAGPIPAGYGQGGESNYIEAQIFGRVRFDRDVKEIHISRVELDALPALQRERLIERMKDANRRMARRFYFVD